MKSKYRVQFRRHPRWHRATPKDLLWRASKHHRPGNDLDAMKDDLRESAETTRIHAHRPDSIIVPTVWRIVNRRGVVIFQTRFF